MRSRGGRAVYRQRSQVAECVNAIAGSRELTLLGVRGLENTRVWFALAHNALLSLPRFRGHRRSHGSAVGVCHGETEAARIF